MMLDRYHDAPETRATRQWVGHTSQTRVFLADQRLWDAASPRYRPGHSSSHCRAEVFPMGSARKPLWGWSVRVAGQPSVFPDEPVSTQAGARRAAARACGRLLRPK